MRRMHSRENTVSLVYQLRLERGEDILATLTAFCAEKRIGSAHMSAIGAIENAVVGAYLLHDKKYINTTYPGIWEVCSFVGNVALVDGQPFIHAHVVISNEKNETIGGHLFGGTVGVTLEVSIQAHAKPIVRILDESIGLKLLSF